ncbi:MAG TPA: hypothetical protein VF313_12215 [Anaerolineaceae bacterium]
MKAKLVPVYFKSAEDPDFVKQLNELKVLLVEEAEILDPIALGKKLPDTDGVIFPQMLGDAYRRLNEIKSLPQPLMVVTSEFGTVSMWDWEINSFLTAKGVKVVGPNTLEKTKQACRAFALKRQLQKSKFLVYQDNPASVGGNQDEIFKRFYWWEPECTKAIEDKYGLKIVKKSFKKLAEDARAIKDEDALKVWEKKKGNTPIGRIANRAVLSAIKLYMKVTEDLDADKSFIAVGMNCLNESRFCETTPCLAWNLLYENRKMVWGCEGDTVSMLTEVLVSETINVPFMMTNLYPFLLGQAALKHEHIPNFPEVDGKPENFILAAHCGYLGVLPQSFSTEWKLKEKVLAIVDDNATAIDARLPEGPVTLVKLMPPFDSWSVIEGNLPKYAQFANSHCLNGAVIEVPNGPKMMDDLVSHHYIVTTGHNLNALEMVSKIFDLECLTIK